MTVQQQAFSIVTEALHVCETDEDSGLAAALIEEIVRTNPRKVILYLAAWVAMLIEEHASTLGQDPLEALQDAALRHARSSL